MIPSRFLESLLKRYRSIPNRFWDELWLVTIIALVALASFGLGRLSVLSGVGKEEFQILYPSEEGAVFGASTGMPEAERAYVASKSGTKYHLPWCAGAQNIKEENKVYFRTKEEAEAAGYTPASNCKGI